MSWEECGGKWSWSIISLCCSNLFYLFLLKRSEVKLFTVKFLGSKCPVHWGDLILRVLDCIVAVWFGVCLVLWLF